MKPLLQAVLSLSCLVAVLPVPAQVVYFRPQDLSNRASMGQFKAEWYARHLQALQEPSLLQRSLRTEVQTYRFLWLRTFDRPVAVRLEVKPDGTGTLFIKIASGAGGYSPGTLRESRTQSVDRTQTASFLREVQSSGFWTLPAESGPTGADGADWIIEGVSRGRYHVASQWTPHIGPIYRLGSALAFELAKLAIPGDRKY